MPRVVVLKWKDSGGAWVGSCGELVGSPLQFDEGDAYIQAGNFSCANPEAMTDADEYTLTIDVCPGATYCPQPHMEVPIPLTPQAVADALCPSPPPMPTQNCDSDDRSCSVCVGGDGPGAASTGGGGPGVGAPGTGPGARLVYQAGGTGSDAFPKPADWTATLGRFWSHDYAERVVPDPDDSHVVLLTRWATYREFTDADADDVYETASPGDEYRVLTQTAGGWELRDLDGTVDHFDVNGRFTQRIDKNGNAKVATYNASEQLESVAFPDGRSETFTYDAGGKLETITEVGIDGTTTRTWTYTWAGDDLTRVDRPDGTAWRFEYDEPLLPGYITRVVLVGTDGTSERVERGFRYDADGNVEAMWKGTADPADPDASDVWLLAFDDPENPGETMVTDPLGNISVYTLAPRSGSRSEKPKLATLSGSCPACGLGPSTQLSYEDATHPYRPTRSVDGKGHVTRFSYDAHGQMTSRIEDFGGALEREAVWTYHPDYPAFVTEIRQPSVTGNLLDERVTTIVYDASGNETTRTILGFEDGAPFSFATVTTPTAAGRIRSIDPPGYFTRDATLFTYDPARGDLVPATRTDPIIGTTTFVHDPFNRRTSVTDVNGVVTETQYDELDRVRFLIRRGETVEEDLVTEHEYNVFGDLFRTILPRGNVIEYGYDVAGRLVSVEHKPDVTTPGERTFYTLDGFGHRTLEELQSWDGAQWVTAAATEFEYSTRCHLDRVVQAPGTPEEAVTEHAYDCDGNLEKTWDPNHPRFPDPPPSPESAPTRHFVYDELERLVEVRRPWTGEGGGEAVTVYGYDVQDHLDSVTDAEGNTTTYTYSDRDLLTEEVSPVAGTATYVYNEHGELVSETDGRGVTVLRTLDMLDRVTFVDTPDPALDTTYVYDDPAVSFSVGRLTAITRGGATVGYAYDRFGRMTEDGYLTYAYDENDNRTEIGYFGVMTAVYGYDFADRAASLTLEGSLAQTVVSSAEYKPFGPLASLFLGNGLAEERRFDGRYSPTRIEVPGHLDAVYTTDGVGNVLSIDRDGLAASFAYQDVDYFLTGASSGPWPSRSWTYDRIGNRLTEDTTTYTYDVNGSGGNTPRLVEIEPAPGFGEGAADLGYDDAGNQTSWSEPRPEGGGVETALLSYGDDRRLSRIERDGAAAATDFVYDGRSFLREAHQTLVGSSDYVRTTASYSSEGVLRARTRVVRSTTGGDSDAGTAPVTFTDFDTVYLLYFGDRPVAQVIRRSGELTPVFFTTDHLGSPILATDTSGAVLWQGGIAPFGELFTLGAGGAAPDGDPADPPALPPPPPPPPPPLGDGRDAVLTSVPVGTKTLNFSTADVFLRYPGQWDDPAWGGYVPGGMYYNVHRWYQPGAGRYIRTDPLGLYDGPNPFLYTSSNPTVRVDPLGLEILVCSRDSQLPWIGEKLNHAYFWDPRSSTPDGHRSCGRGRNSRKEKGPIYDNCKTIPGSAGKEDVLMLCCEEIRKIEPFVPFFNDCHQALNACTKATGLGRLSAPGGRLGRPCDECPVAPRPMGPFMPPGEGIFPP